MEIEKCSIGENNCRVAEQPLQQPMSWKKFWNFYLKRIRIKYLAQIYQAIRIEVNQEMDALKEFLEQSLEILNREEDWVLFHIIHWKIDWWNDLWKNGVWRRTERDFFGNFSVPFKTVGKLIILKEIKLNRARSAKLRIAEKK
jgi:16S rRNA (cytosine1402-N4)-methyltransferase